LIVLADNNKEYSLNAAKWFWLIMVALYVGSLSSGQKWSVIFALPLLALCLSGTSIASLAFASQDTTTASNSVNSSPTATAANANNSLSSVTEDDNNKNATASQSVSDGIVTAGKPLFREHIVVAGANPVNPTFIRVSLIGNGTLELANSTSILKTNSTGSADVNFKTTSVIGTEILKTEDRKDNATLTLYEITRHNIQTHTEKGVVIAIFYTNSTGRFASLDGTIAVGTAEVEPSGNTNISLWQYNTGIPFVKNWMKLLMKST
jgi:hypothetical protein